MGEPEIKKICNKTDEVSGKCDEEVFVITRSAWNILPDELWEIIFTELKDPRDLLNVWNTTSEWTPALCSTHFYFKMTLPFLLPYLSKEDFLAVSSVSKSWNATVDTDTCLRLAEEFKTGFTLPGDQSTALELCFADLFLFATEFDLKQNKLATNPVPFRSVNISLDIGEISDEGPGLLSQFLKSLPKFLSYCGHLIQHFNLRITDEDEGSISCLKKIQLIHTCLEKTPNVHSVYLAVEDEMEELQEGELEEINDFIQQNPWPVLHHLTWLEFGQQTHQKEYATITTAYAPQLVHFAFAFPISPERLLPTGFERLEEILYWSQSRSLPEFGRFVQSLHSLKSLTVVFNDDLNEDDYAGVTVAANAASATLETLTLGFDGDSDGVNLDLGKFDGLHLPCLKTLKYEVIGYPSLNWLSTVCPAVEQLTVSPGYFQQQSAGHYYFSLYSQHRFWKRLPCLQRADVGFVIAFQPRGFNRMRKSKTARQYFAVDLRRNVFTRGEYKKKLRENCATSSEAQVITLD